MCFRRWSDYVKELCTAVDDATSVHCGFDFHPALSDCTIEMSSQWERITTLCVTGVNFSPSTVHPTKLMIPHFFFCTRHTPPCRSLNPIYFCELGRLLSDNKRELDLVSVYDSFNQIFSLLLWCLDWLAVWCARVMHGITRRMSTHNKHIFYIPFAQKICSHIARNEFNSISHTRIYDCEFFMIFMLSPYSLHAVWLFCIFFWIFLKCIYFFVNNPPPRVRISVRQPKSTSDEGASRTTSNTELKSRKCFSTILRSGCRTIFLCALDETHLHSTEGYFTSSSCKCCAFLTSLHVLNMRSRFVEVFIVRSVHSCRVVWPTHSTLKKSRWREFSLLFSDEIRCGKLIFISFVASLTACIITCMHVQMFHMIIYRTIGQLLTGP